ncbi:polysaccharide pyruvyl transferase family protein [Parvularcula sp. IMCC14364]|uniref:polysaccharide pyruvyl transferase family protein n=1 Tax=Parvularcula sp. IMCC14364 TaxID=3067902 RepID=UPI002741EB9D|nr:polysaccharide pyruvyl transferase family protein [Parvularcula sp. IMCC14364]
MKFFSVPQIKNPTRPDAGDDAAFLDGDGIFKRVGNSGNMAFMYAIRQHVDSIRHASESNHGNPDVFVVGASNQVNKNVTPSLDMPMFRQSLPIVQIGLGAQAPNLEHDFEMQEATLAWIEKIQSLSPTDYPNISVRGMYTYSVFEKYGVHQKAVPLGCPSLFINPAKNLGAIIKAGLKTNYRRIGTGPGNLMAKAQHIVPLERSLAEIAEWGGGGYLVQHPKQLFSLSFGDRSQIAEEDLDHIRARIKPHLTTDEFCHWFAGNAKLFVNVPSWLHYARSLDAYVGMRIHGTMLTIQSGKPALCVALDSRQHELCQIMHIPHIAAEEFFDGVNIGKVTEVLATHDWDAFDENRRNLSGKYIEFLNNNKLKETELIAHLAA